MKIFLLLKANVVYLLRHIPVLDRKLSCLHSTPLYCLTSQMSQRGVAEPSPQPRLQAAMQLSLLAVVGALLLLPSYLTSRTCPCGKTGRKCREGLLN